MHADLLSDDPPSWDGMPGMHGVSFGTGSQPQGFPGKFLPRELCMRHLYGLHNHTRSNNIFHSRHRFVPMKRQKIRRRPRDRFMWDTVRSSMKLSPG